MASIRSARLNLSNTRSIAEQTKMWRNANLVTRRSLRNDQQAYRYTTIHRFFSSYARESLRPRGSIRLAYQGSIQTRSFFWGSSRSRHSDPEEDAALAEIRSAQSRKDDHWNMRSDQPYHNYPRSLRELALRARERGTREAEKEFREALAETERRVQLEANSSSDKNGGSSSSGTKDDKEGSSENGGESEKDKKSSSRWTRPRPPSKEELLHLAQGFWTRLRIRFKWFTIRGFRRFNADDISAFFTLGGLGTVVFIIVGTTTAVSLVFSALNALNMQEWIARKIADYLTAETGVTVIFESAIVPKWKESRICFQNVFISRRAYNNDAETLREERGVADGLQPKSGKRRGMATTAGHGMAWEGTHFTEYDDEEVAPPMSDEATGNAPYQVDGRHTNFSMFDMNVDSIEVKLSFKRWWDGKGLVEDAVVEGVRGIIDRRNVFWDPDKPYDPRAARRFAKHGDFELDSLTIKDFLVTVYQPSGFRPFNLSIFEAQMPRLRKQWLFYDLLGADRITGQVDGCLFSLHKPQSIGRTNGRERELLTGRWKSLSRLRIDGINFDHIQNQSDVHGPVSWILSGKFDVVADIKLPTEASSDIDINVIISEMLDHFTQAVGANDQRSDGPIPGQHRLSGPAIEAPVTTVGPASESAWKQKQKEEELEAIKNKTHQTGWRDEMEMAAREVSKLRRGNRGEEGTEKESSRQTDTIDESKNAEGDAKEVVEAGTVNVSEQSSLDASQPAMVPNAASVIIDLDVRFKDIKAAVPLYGSDLTYRTQTFVRPIVAFMNANHTLIPVHCRVVMDLTEFDGAMDLAQTGLLPIISEKIYEALANHVQSQGANNRRIRSVSQWWLRLASDQVLQYARLIRDTMVRNRNPMENIDPGHLSLARQNDN
ncbi:uncharacterized protein FA14DRAFT_159614 [Meira miltonrushii]|uniref:Mitochondrial distribution and morphology protein family 31/32 n=1 Tax=Meira miltonrushii TaxID=1280837 RepID=A0A316VQA7_9BASI|nr:uncharacterized protein FA14DRAFT_159614 [Meira miltonrushii]PWN37675.1 hypothetical protein FA14DRAFT_159614 [Meira miltonrushii]